MTQLTPTEAFCDGSCLGNPGAGGWAFMIPTLNVTRGGNEKHTTNNIMELRAAIEAIRYLVHYKKIRIYTDSTYLSKGITEWIHKWRRNNWRTSAKKPVKNHLLWQELDTMCEAREIEWQWIKGHNNHSIHDQVDALAREYAMRVNVTLQCK